MTQNSPIENSGATATKDRGEQTGPARSAASAGAVPGPTGERWRSRQGEELAVRGGGELTRPVESHAELVGDHGTTRIADVVVAKIAGVAAQEIPGVHSMGKGLARRIGQLRARVPGNSPGAPLTQGVSVEVGQKEAAVDLEIVTWYGENIVAITESVRTAVTEQIESITGLSVVEVNIHVVDIHVEDEDDDTNPRVQ